MEYYQMNLFNIGRPIIFCTPSETVKGTIIGYSDLFDDWFEVKANNGDIWDVPPMREIG